ncbi:hypothetical protein H1R20_g459, partial [Candolleomyces eurysporus]
MPMSRNLHYIFDKLGFYGLTCTKETLLSLIDIVDTENDRWKERAKKGAVYIREFDLEGPTFTDAEYEFVPLYPNHMFMNGTGMTAYSTTGDATTFKHYVVADDSALREGVSASQPRFPVLSSPRRLQVSHSLNPFLVVLNADMVFRRFRRVQAAVVCSEFNELIDLTLQLAAKIYYQPLIDQAKTATLMEIVHDKDKDTEMGKETRKTRRTGNATGASMGSRLGYVVPDPGPNASTEEWLEYKIYLMSGCDLPDPPPDEDEDELLTEPLILNDDDSSPFGITETVDTSEKVQNWLSNSSPPNPDADVIDT